MVNSMTGFGRAAVERDGRQMTVELKSVNHRYLDLGFRMPRMIGFVEDVIRTALGRELSRGHIEVYVYYKNSREDARTVNVDLPLLEEYLKVARGAAQKLSLTDDLGLYGALRLPDVTEIVQAEEDRAEVSSIAEEACLLACGQLKAMRAREGERLYRDLYEKSESVERIAHAIGERAPMVVDEYRIKLNERIEKLLSGVEVDRTRLATEVALFADKASIDEELVRLSSHVSQFRAMLDGSEPAGRKLDFIVQEMNREFNTIGSKANDGEIVGLVIKSKGEIEKIREQVQNIE